MIRTRLAELPDAGSISALLTANAGDRGGMLLGQWPPDAIERRISNGQLIVLATSKEGGLLGALLTSEKGFGEAPPVQAMLKAWPGRADAYVYGPVCISEDARGRGVLEALYAKLQAVRRAARRSSSSGKTTRALSRRIFGWGCERSRDTT